MKEREFFKVILYDGFLVKHSGPGLGMDVVFSEHTGSQGSGAGIVRGSPNYLIPYKISCNRVSLEIPLLFLVRRVRRSV